MQNITAKFSYSLLAVATMTALTACGGGGGGSSSTTTINPATNTSTATTTTTPTASQDNPTTTTTVANPTQPTTQVSNTSAEMSALNRLNAQRTQCGFASLTTDTSLNATATNHANYLINVSERNKQAYATHDEALRSAWVGSGSSNPYYSGNDLKERLAPTTLGAQAIKTSYSASGFAENLAVTQLQTNNLSATYNAQKSAENMLKGLLAAPYHMRGLLSPNYTQIGVSYKDYTWQSNSMYNVVSVLELVSARPLNLAMTDNKNLLNYPCTGVTGTEYLLNNELPNPFGTTRDLKNAPIGQPTYVLAPIDKVIKGATATYKLGTLNVGAVHVLLKSNNPNQANSPLFDNEVIFMPDAPLMPNRTYTVDYQLTYSDNTTVSKTFSFTTKAS